VNLEDESEEKQFFAARSAVFPYRVRNTYKLKVWSTVKFKPNGKPAPNSGVNLLTLFDADKPLYTLWQLLPWSFLVDYFVDVSDFLGASYSSHSVRSICIMRHQIATQRVVSDDGEPVEQGFGFLMPSSKIKVSSRLASVEHKERQVFTGIAFAPVKFFLGTSQVANIIALASSRR
jgi:hypothetical protein